MFFNQEANKDISAAQIENRFNLKVLLKNDSEHNNSHSEMRREMWDSCLIVIIQREMKIIIIIY